MAEKKNNPLSIEEMSEIMLDVQAGRPSRLNNPTQKKFRENHEKFVADLPEGATVAMPCDHPDIDE